MTGITFQTGASFNGRALAQTAVILDGNKVGTTTINTSYNLVESS
jgi:hypothetical protein